jgi:antitoxin ParD1/3/4
MTSLNISIPESMKAFVDQQVARKGYSDASAYFQALVEAEQSRNRRGEIEEQLAVALDSPSTEMTAQDWDSIRQRGRQYIAEHGR